MRRLRLAIFTSMSFAIMLTVSSCAPDPAATTPWVEIPMIVIVCQTTNCRQNVNPRIYAQLTTSGCASPTSGAQRTVDMTTLVCSAGSGCIGSLQPWLYQDTRATTGIPSGTYSICVRIDYNGDYPATTTGDTTGVVNSYRIDSTSAATDRYIYSTWTDL